MKELACGASRWRFANVLLRNSFKTTIACAIQPILRRQRYSTPATPEGALAGVKILDLSRVLAVRHLSQLLNIKF